MKTSIYLTMSFVIVLSSSKILCADEVVSHAEIKSQKAEHAYQSRLPVPVSTILPGATYPKVEDNGHVTFRLKAPKATSVKIAGGEGLVKEPLDMIPSVDGSWSITTPTKADVGFHYHWFEVDGLRVNDPGTYSFFGWGRETSGVEVPTPGENFHHFHPGATAGSVAERWYVSQLTGRLRRCFVYLPASYMTDNTSTFPVLYLLHGAGECERSWIEQGRLQFILDNAIAARIAKPMIVVADSGYAAFADSPADANDRQSATAAFEQVLLEELVPMIDQAYRTKASAKDRALAGLSMGGGQSLAIGLKHPEVLASVAAMSAGRNVDFNTATAYGGVMKDANAFNSRFKRLWLSAGTNEKPTFDAINAMHHALDAAGIRHALYISDATAHEWHTWRRSLHELVQCLFEEE